MTLLSWLVPVALGMGLVGLIAFLWSMKSGQLEDLDGAAERVLLHEADDAPLPGDTATDRPILPSYGANDARAI
ncbi:MAG: cbb3-type cytochrome oxidase assembly protein CcoS [Mesorhizobium sp.]